MRRLRWFEKQIPQLRLGMTNGFVVWALLCAGSADAGPVPLADSIAAVRTVPPAGRARAAEHLYEVTRGVKAAAVDDKTVAEMTALLDIDDDGVRLWVAGSLGNLGHRAAAAIPKLLATLGKVECHGKTMPSDQAVRFALTRIGKKPPPPACMAPPKPDTTKSPKLAPAPAPVK
jgi:hypothetical protein